jgi:hypothetical protein
MGSTGLEMFYDDCFMSNAARYDVGIRCKI